MLALLDQFGWHLPNAIAAFWGACVSLSYRRPASFPGVLIQLGIGTASGNYAAPAPQWFFAGLPDQAEPLLAFLIGLTAMHWLIPAVFGLLGLGIVYARERIGDYLARHE